MTQTIDFSHYIRDCDGGVMMMDFAVDDVTCADCIHKIETSLGRIEGVEKARLNYTNRRLHVEWMRGRVDPSTFVSSLKKLGYRAYPFKAMSVELEEEHHMRWLLRCLAVSGFGTMNIMLLSVSLWAGDFSGMTQETRDLFHWISALIALPVAAFSGQPFFNSAFRALRARRMNMDVPISLAILLALVMSVYETVHHAEHAYFDSAAMLLTFLLLGRTLDHAMRRKTRAIAGNLASLHVMMATRVEDDGALVSVPAGVLKPGDQVLVRPGERIPADGVLIRGAGEIDESLVTGETRRRAIKVNDHIYAGAMNFSDQLVMKVLAAGDNTLLHEIERLMDNAMTAKAAALRLADRVVRIYAPFVHFTALVTALGWIASGADLHTSIIVAITVLIITCPCALALAVPAVQVTASGAMFRSGLLLNTGDAIERIAVADTVVFDKTGTLTLPEPDVVNRADIDDRLFELAGRLAQSSHHPLAKALARAALFPPPFEDASETVGQGVAATVQGMEIRLGSPQFCNAGTEAEKARLSNPDASILALRCGDEVAIFLMHQMLRDDAKAIVNALRDQGLSVEILSGDRSEAVEPVARLLGIDRWKGDMKPKDKTDRLAALAEQGRKVVMVGDGINDAPALASAHASMSPVSASDLAQSCADAVFLGDALKPVLVGINLARRARHLMIQNLALSIVYNAIALPLAIAGYATPLIAAVAMSGSSLLVTVNALRAQGPVLRGNDT